MQLEFRDLMVGNGLQRTAFLYPISKVQQIASAAGWLRLLSRSRCSMAINSPFFPIGVYKVLINAYTSPSTILRKGMIVGITS